MKTRFACAALCALLVGAGAGCPKKQPAGPAPSRVDREKAAAPAVSALQAADFERAAGEADKVLKQDRGNSQAAVVRAVSRYMKAMHNFLPDLMRRAEHFGRAGDKMRGYLHRKFAEIEKELGRVDRDLAVAAKDPGVWLKLCLACWQRDWNHDGRINDIDAWVFQIELDADGRRIPPGDPRRKPTFRFDRGDVFWARAMVSFQRALFNLLVAYRLPSMKEVRAAGKGDRMFINLVSKKRVQRAKKLILSGLEHAERARREYLAEKDDEAEWVPNPSQKNHPLPLPVDDKLYETWKGVVSDLTNLVLGREGLSVSELAQLGDYKWTDPPGGYIHIGRLLSKPGDIVISTKHLERLERKPGKQDIERILEDVFGDKYVRKMKPTQLITRLLRMKNEIARGKESLGRKLRYLLWLN